MLIEVPQDEDTNSVSLIKSQTDLLVIKEDCINHIGKCVKKYLMKLKQEKTRRIQSEKPAKKHLASPAAQQQLLDDNKK